MHYNDNWKRGWRPRQAWEKVYLHETNRALNFETLISNTLSLQQSARTAIQNQPCTASCNKCYFVSFWNISNISYPSCWRQSLFTKSAKPAPRSDQICTNPLHIFTANIFMFSVTHNSMCIVWQLVSNCSAGHNQAIVQEHEHIQKLSAMRQQDRPLCSKNVFNCIPNIFSM